MATTKYLKLLLNYAVILDSGRLDVAPLQFSLIPGDEVKPYDGIVDDNVHSPTYNAHTINNYVEAKILSIVITKT